MTTDIQTVLQRTTPETVPDLDVAALRARGRRRRAAKRAGSAGALALVVLAGVVVPAWLRTPEPIRFAQEQPASWADLDYQTAVARLRETARANAAVPPAAVGHRREIRLRGVVGRGVSDDTGTREWMVPFEVRIREGLDSWRGVHEEDHIQHGVTLEEVRRILAELPAPAEPTTVVEPDDPPKPDPGGHAPAEPIDEAEHLATKPDPYEPSPGETERPDRAYAFIRLADALRAQPLDPATLDRGYGVLAALGEGWVAYRGMVQDLAGRDAIAFSAADPANSSESWLLFDPDTGRVWGELTYQLPADGPEFRGGAVVEYLEVPE